MLTKKTSLFALILVITLAHIGILSLHFEWPKRLSFRQPDIGASMIAAGLRQSTEPIKTDAQESKKVEASNNEEIQAGSSSPSKTKRSAFSIRNSTETETLDAFEMSQKIREQLLLNEFRSRSSHAEGALVQLRQILFQNQESGGKLICCTISNTVNNASCTDPATEIYYKKIADSLRSQLNAIQFLGISKICNRD
jgi:hypothetical protein